MDPLASSRLRSRPVMTYSGVQTMLPSKTGVYWGDGGNVVVVNFPGSLQR